MNGDVVVIVGRRVGVPEETMEKRADSLAGHVASTRFLLISRAERQGRVDGGAEPFLPCRVARLRADGEPGDEETEDDDADGEADDGSPAPAAEEPSQSDTWRQLAERTEPEPGAGANVVTTSCQSVDGRDAGKDDDVGVAIGEVAFDHPKREHHSRQLRLCRQRYGEHGIHAPYAKNEQQDLDDDQRNNRGAVGEPADGADEESERRRILVGAVGVAVGRKKIPLPDAFCCLVVGARVVEAFGEGSAFVESFEEKESERQKENRRVEYEFLAVVHDDRRILLSRTAERMEKLTVGFHLRGWRSAAVRITFFGYSSVGHASLRTLCDMGCEIVSVVTHRDDPNENRWFPSVAGLAREHGLEVLELPGGKLSEAARRQVEKSLAGQRVDLIVSASFRSLLPPEILALTRLGGVNLHGSLLPRYRGRAPLNWALLHGEAETGMTLHHMNEAADAGDIIGQCRLVVGENETAPELQCRLDAAAVDLLRAMLPAVAAGTAPRRPQDPRQATEFGRRRPTDGQFHWRWPARRIHNLVRAVTRPFPGAFVVEPEPLRVWRAVVPAPTGELAAASGAPPGTVVERHTDRLCVMAGDGVVELLDWEGGGGAVIGEA